MKSHNNPKALEAWINLISDKPMKDGTLTPFDRIVKSLDPMTPDDNVSQLIADAREVGKLVEREEILKLIDPAEPGINLKVMHERDRLRSLIMQRTLTDQASSPDSQDSRPNSQAA